VTYTNSRDFKGNPEAGTAGDLGPEGVLALAADESPNGRPLLITANETSGSVALYEMTVPPPAVALAANIVTQGRDSFAREMTLDGSTSTGVAPLDLPVAFGGADGGTGPRGRQHATGDGAVRPGAGRVHV
jgi:hypothetical protein